MRTLACVLLGAALAFAQQTAPDPKKALARAIVIEQEERDLAQAERLYRELAASSRDQAVQQEAERRLQKLRSRLSDTQPLGDEDTLRTQRALQKLRADDEGSWKHGLDDLLFVGSAAVPELRRQLLEEKRNRSFIAYGVTALTRMGGESAANAIREIIEKCETFTRKAALDGVRAGVRGYQVSVPVRQMLPAFLRVPEPELPVRAIQELGSAMRLEDLLELTDPAAKDSSEEISRAAFASLADRRQSGVSADQRPLVVAAFAKALQKPAPEVSQIAVAFGFTFDPSAAWQRAFLLALPQVSNDRVAVHGQSYLLRRETLPAFVEAVRKIGARSEKNPNHWTVVDHIAAAFGPNGPQYPKDDIAVVLELYKLGVTGVVEWLARNAQQEHVLAIAEALRDSQIDGTLVNWLRNRDELPATLLAPLRAIHQSLRTPQGWNDRWSVGELIARLRTPEAIAYLADLCKQDVTFAANQGAYLLVLASRDPVEPATEHALCDTLVGKLEGNASTQARGRIWFRLVQLGSKAAMELYPQALLLGIDGIRPFLWKGPGLVTPDLYQHNPGMSLSPIDCLLPWHDPTDASKPKRWHAYSDDDLVRIFELLFAEPDAPAWSYCSSVIASLHQLPLGVTAALCSRVHDAYQRVGQEQFLKLLQKAYLGGAPRTDAVFAMLERLMKTDRALAKRAAAAELARGQAMPPRALALLQQMVEDPDTIDTALPRLQTLDAKQFVPSLRKLLANESPSVRRTAANALVRQLGRDAIPDLVPLLADPSASVRADAAARAGELGDKRFVPGLLALLRDPDESARTAARTALERLQFLEQQQSFWKKLADDTGLDAPNAAAALVKQAGKDQPKTVRLVAIDSLGTLGVAETLPFLIQVMQETDAEVSARALAALQKINARSVR